MTIKKEGKSTIYQVEPAKKKEKPTTQEIPAKDKKLQEDA